MDFELKQEDLPEMTTFRGEVKSWLAKHMRDGLHFTWSANWSTREAEDEYAFRRHLAQELGALGWLFPTFPRQYGGGGLSADHQTVLDG